MNPIFHTTMLPVASVITPTAELVILAWLMVTNPSVKLNAVGVKYPLKLGPSGAATVKDPVSLHSGGQVDGPKR